MLLIENIRLALNGLKANKMRALLTMLGIIIGISSVIAIMTVGNSLTVFMNEAYADMGINNIDVMVERRMTEEEMNELLTPSAYIGRCAQQVDALVKKVQPLIAEIDRESAQINL